MKDVQGKKRIASLRLLSFVIGLALVSSACSSEPPAQEAKGSTPVAAADSATQSEVADSATDTANETTDSAVSENATEAIDEATGKGAGEKLDGPLPPNIPWESVVPVKATLSTRCIHGGETMTLTVKTQPEAAIIYQAVYSDNLGGAPKPLGGGYGGNDKGYADSNGSWTDTWVVSPDAPRGAARVDVIVGWNQEWGYNGPEFEVASVSRCGP